MSLNQTNRLTSKDIRVEYIPCGTEPATHDEDLVFSTNVDGGTFKLRFNGELTSAITFDETAQGTTATAIASALNALPNVGGITFACTGTDTDADSEDDTFSITADIDGWVRLNVESIDTLTASGGGDISVNQVVQTQGTEVFVISTEFTQFSTSSSVETVDVTAISEYEGTEIPVKSTMSFDATIYDAEEDFTEYVMEEGQNGLFTVFKKGKVVGYPYFSFIGLLESVDLDFPDHEKLEISISGMRQGAMIVPMGSIYR